jgi:hypothetical protein
MSALAVVADPDLTPMTNRGVYPHSKWSDSAIDYYRASVGAGVETLLTELARGLEKPGLPVIRGKGPAVRHYASHVVLHDPLGKSLASVFWGGANLKPNVEAKGAQAPAVARILRANWSHRPSRVDVKRDASAPGLFRRIRKLAGVTADRHGLLPPKDHLNNHPDMGDTCYVGSRQSQAFLRIYQPSLKRAQEEGRTGDQISDEERNTVRVELEFKPQKPRAKHAAASLAPDQMWGVSPWIADFAGEVFAMDVRPVSISERRETNRNRALRFMASQYQAHLADLLRECQGDYAQFGETIADLAGIERSRH